MKNIILICFALFLAGAVASCKKLDGGAEDSLTAISLKDTATLRVGDIYQVPISVTPSNYSKISLVWKSADTTVLSINNIGVVTAKKVGKSVVTVSNKSGAIAMSCLVTVVAKPVPPVPPVDSLKVGLIAHYALNNSGVDSSGKGNHITYYANAAATTNRFGIANSAFYFNGINSYMIVKDNADLRLSNTDYTLNVWVNKAEYNNSYGVELLCKRGAGNAQGWNYGITGKLNQLYNGTLLGVNTMNLSGGGDPLALGTKIITLNEWHMLTTVYNLQKKQISFYVDGVLTNTVNNMPTPNPNATADLYIGQDSQDITATAYFLKGKLDDIRIYSRALSAKDIGALFISAN